MAVAVAVRGANAAPLPTERPLRVAAAAGRAASLSLPAMHLSIFELDGDN